MEPELYQGFSKAGPIGLLPSRKGANDLPWEANFYHAQEEEENNDDADGDNGKDDDDEDDNNDDLF